MESWQQPPNADRPRVALLSYQDDLDLVSPILQSGLSSASPCVCMPVQLAADQFDNCIEKLRELEYVAAYALGAAKVDAARVGQKLFMSKHSFGTANALLFRSGGFAQNTEVDAVKNLIADLPPKKALVLGTGAVARSTIMALIESDWKVRVWNRSALKARPLLPLFARWAKLELVFSPDPAECSLVVNCTPLGARPGEKPPLLWDSVRPKTVFMDFVSRRVATEFIRAATTRGLVAIDGRRIGIESMAIAIEWWLNKPIDRTPMLAAGGLLPHDLP